MIQHTASLPYGYVATFHYAADTGFNVEWQPTVPHIRNPGRLRRFMTAYRIARDAFMADLAGVVGGSVLTVDLAKDRVEAMTVAKPSTKH